jgi:pilus assembly protein CpaB
LKINKKILIFAVLIGLLTVFGLGLYINNLPNAQKNRADYSKAVVATNTIPANAKVTADMVTLKSMSTESVHPEAITSLDKIIGAIYKGEIVKGEQLLLSKVVVDVEQATLAYRVPQNMRAISIPTSEVSGVGGFINVGDKIDILVTYDKKDINPVSTTYTQLQNIEVAAVGNAKLSADDKQKALPTSITVLVNPAQAEVLAYAISNGILSFNFA